MKKVILSIALVMSSYAFASTPPKSVTETFAKKFPTATKVSWGKEGTKEWEAEFTLEGTKISANFALDGAWVETERGIKITELPKKVAEAIAKQYPGWKITEADRTETAKNCTIYEADIKNGLKKNEVAFKEDGTPVKEY